MFREDDNSIQGSDVYLALPDILAHSDPARPPMDPVMILQWRLHCYIPAAHLEVILTRTGLHVIFCELKGQGGLEKFPVTDLPKLSK
eukprot:1148698-Pelagomonas_calceolata.AAC.3